MKTIEGEFENGVVRLLGEVPEFSNKKVLITFFNEEDSEENFLRVASLQQPENFLKTYLEDKREDLYQEYLSSSNDNR